MDTSRGFKMGRDHQQQAEEEDENVSFGVSPVRYADVEDSSLTGMLGSRSASSNSSVATAASNASAEMGTARASSAHSGHSCAEDNLVLKTSMSRKHGWLPFPPAKKNVSDSHDPAVSSPSNSSDDTKASQAGSSGSRSSPEAVSPRARASTEPSPSSKMYELKVKRLYYKLSPPKHPVLSKMIKILTTCTTATDDNDKMTDRYILRNINFEARPSELLGIAGPSGAGKSTILECLAGRLQPSSPPGCILVNNQIMDPSSFRRISGYVMQDDALFATLTVMETLLISARLRLPSTMSLAEKMSRVQSLLGELGLQHAANTRIGNELVRGVSGGERRRVSIGVDVIHDPAVLFLDEPTSGLDSGAALNVIAMLRGMAVSRSRTVILTMHQPSYRILKLMHSILLVAGGMVVHHGSLELLGSRLATAGHEVPARTNVLEYAIDAVNSWETEDSIGSYDKTAKGQTLQQIFSLNKESPGSGPNLKDVETGLSIYEADSWDNDGKDRRIFYSNNVFHETAILTERFFKTILRTKELFPARSLQAVIAGVILGTVFLNVDNKRQGVSDRLGFFVFTISYLLNSTTEALPIFLQERQILMRETSRGAYRISSYVLSHAVVFVPFLLTIAILYGAPSYWLTGLNSNLSNFLFYGLVLWLTLLLANSFVAFFSAVVPNYIMGQALVAAFMGAFFLFSGYIINRNNIPKYWIWMHYISLFKYPFDGLLLNEFGDHRDRCFSYDMGHLRAFSHDITGICTLNGAQVLHNAGVAGHSKWMNVAAMAGFIVFYRLASYAAVRWRLQQRHC